MKKSITQKFEYGCGIACFAFVTDLSYAKAENCLGIKQATSNRFWVKDLTVALNLYGKPYISKYVKPHIKKLIYQEGTIVLIKRSNHYPVGHYLVRHNNSWMDPWINLLIDRDIKKAKSGFRYRLPGIAMYAIFPG